MGVQSMAYREGTGRRVRALGAVASVVSASVVVAGLSWATGAAAQDGADKAAAQALFDEAKKLVSESKFAEACPKLEESQRLDPGFGTAFYLADCWQHVGKTASAWALYLDVAGATKAAGQVDRSTLARTRASALEGKLSRLTITVADPAPNIRVERDGVTVGRALWGSSVPVDPGDHRIVASAEGKKSFEKTVTVAPDGASESVTVPALEDAVAPTDTGKPLTATPRPEEDQGVSSAKATLSHEGQIGTFLRADGAGIAFAQKDSGGNLIGPAPALGVAYGAAPFLDISLAALLGDGKGFEPAGTFLFLSGQVKPRATLAVPVLFIEGARGGLRGAVGVEWDPSRTFGVFLDIGAAYFFTMPSGYDKLVPVPSVGISGRL